MLTRYIDWVAGAALPYWASHGFNRAAGRFHERLDAGGRPLAVPHRAMVQARQIFVFAHTATLGWQTEGGALAAQAMRTLERSFVRHQGDEASLAFSIDPASGDIVSEVRDAYAHAFVLFAIAALYRLEGDRRLLDLADGIVRFVEHRLADPQYGGLFDALPAPHEKRQNPHMHLLEAYLFLARAAPGRGYEERAAALVALFKRRFFHDGLLLEFFEPDWSIARPVWEPGHHFEWVWLLSDYQALTGDGTRLWQDTLYATACAKGAAEDGLLRDALADDGRVIAASSRVWPHTEAIKAAATREGESDARSFADRMAAALLGRFLDRPFAGGWIDHVAPDREPLVDYVPASTLYHLVLAASVAHADAAHPTTQEARA